MPVGLVAFEISSSSLQAIKRLRTKVYAEANAAGKSLKKHLAQALSRARPNKVTVLLLTIALYLILSRCGPVLTRVGESTFETFDLNKRLLRGLDPVGLQSLKGVYSVFRGLTRVPGPFSHRSFSVVLFILGSTQNSSKLKELPSTSKRSDNIGTKENPITYNAFEDRITAGDLAILKHSDKDITHFAIFIQHEECHGHPLFPLVVIKEGKTKPLLMFEPSGPRHAHTVSAVTRIFYGDYEVVAVRKLKTSKKLGCHETLKILDEISFLGAEREVVGRTKSLQEQSSFFCAFMVAHFYKKLGVLQSEPNDITPGNLEANLELGDPVYIKLPEVKEGPIAYGELPLLSRLIDGIIPPSIGTGPVELNSVIGSLQTGDLVLFSGVTPSGAIIRFFDKSQFSHVGIVMRTEFISQVLVWEASTNKAGLVDIDTGEVRRGVELVPLQDKISSGWYSQVAIRRLTDIDEVKRTEMNEKLLAFKKEVQGRPYETSILELILAGVDFQEDYLFFLQNSKEDLSSLFCSELVAAAYKRMGILNTKKLANEFTPDDFSSSHNSKFQLNFGRLEKEIYLKLEFD